MGGLIWLASYPKSGNTWTRALLHNLIRQGDSTHSINEMTGLTSTDNAPVWYEEVLGKEIVKATQAEIAEARPKVHKLIHDSSDGFVFLKTHNALVAHLDVPLITSKWTAGAIYIVRNPLDVAISYAHHMNVSIDESIEVMGEKGRWTDTHEKGAYQILGSWTENVESWTRKPNPSLFVMRYEDMLTKGKETFGRLCAWLNLDVDEARLLKAIELSSFDKLQSQEQEAGFKEKPQAAERFFREGKAGQWKNTLNVAQIRRIVRDHKAQMAKYGYLDEAERFLIKPDRAVGA